jgi:cytoskeletal protein RodZ
MVFKNKQTVNKRKFSKKSVIIILLVLLVAAALSWFLFFKNESSNNTTETTSDNSYHINSLDELEDPDNTPSEITPNDDDVPSRNPDYTPPVNGLVTITRVEVAGDAVVVAALVQGNESGECTATYSNGSARVTGSAPIQQGPTYFACQVSIPRSQFTLAGSWKIIVTAGTASGESEVSL